MIESKDGTSDAMMQSRREHAYPLWPTSKPGPGVTLPPPGQKPLWARTDQMVYASYDQERGIPCVLPPTRAVRENQTRTSLSVVSLQEVDTEAIERWLDDGGALDNEAAYDARGFTPSSF